MRRIHLVIFGRVQGVGFRYFCQSHAERLGLTGYVQNREDGSVEVEIQGTSAAVAEFERMVHTGPRTSQVTNVKWEDIALGSETEFRIARSS